MVKIKKKEKKVTKKLKKNNKTEFEKLGETIDKQIAGEKIIQEPKIEEEIKESNKEYSEKYKEILKDPELFNKMFIDELDKVMVGEIESRKVLGLCAYGGRLVENSQIASFNVMVNDDSGVGKDYITNAILSMIPSNFYLKKTRISPTVLNYWKKDEPQWNWNGKCLYLEDISETILNHEVFKVMCSSGTSASIVKDQKVIEIEVEGKPVIIITTATATPNPELVRRFVILNLDSSINQTKEIMKRHSEYKQKGIIPRIEEKYKIAMQFLKQVNVRIPFADKIYSHFPSNNIIMRTQYPRFLDFISASSAFHQYQRKEEKGFILATGKDYNLARECFIKLCSNKYMIPLTINQKKILEIFEKEPYMEASISQLHASKMNFISDRALSYNLSLLASYGILETNPKLNEQNKTIECYRLNKTYNPNEKIYIPTYEELCRITSEPSEPSTPSSTSEPSEPTRINKNNKKSVINNEFLEVAKVPKREMGFREEVILQKNPKIKQIMEEFSE